MTLSAKGKSDPASFAAFRGRWIERGMADPVLSDGAFRTLAGLAHHFLNREQRKIWAAQETIATKLGKPVRTLQGHLAELQQRGLIRMQRQGRDRPNLYFPVLDDAQGSADHGSDDTQKSAHHKQAKTRKIASHDTQVCAPKTRKNLRTNPLKEPLEEPVEGGGAYAPTASIDGSSALVESDANAPSTAPDGAAGASDDQDEGMDWPSDYVPFLYDDDPADFVDECSPDLPIRAEPEDWRRLLAWIGQECGPEALERAVKEKRAGTLTIATILSFERRAADVA